MPKVILNGCDEFGYAVEDAAAEPFLSQVSEEAFHHERTETETENRDGVSRVEASLHHT